MKNAETAKDAETTADQLTTLILRLGRRLRQHGGVGLNPIDLSILVSLRHFPELGLSELAEREAVSRPAMSMHLRRLTEAGFLKRETHGLSDGRRARFRLTPAARTALSRVQRHRTHWLHERLSGLDSDELIAIKKALQALGKLMEAPEK